MSTSPITPASTLEDKILSVINGILQVLPLVVPGGAVAAALGVSLIHALQAYQAQVGQPINFALIPQEAQV
jgi:hypothetical protein